MTTTVTLYETPLNIDYLMQPVRMQSGDLTGAQYSDTIVRTSIVNAVQYLQHKWMSKYQIYNTSLVIDPQPDNIPGYERIMTVHGLGDVPIGLSNGDVFRNPYLKFTQVNTEEGSTTLPPVIESDDEIAIILAATYILRRVMLTSNIGAFVTWKTEDIAYSNLGNERQLGKLLEMDKDALDDFFKKLPRPVKTNFAISYVPVIYV